MKTISRALAGGLGRLLSHPRFLIWLYAANLLLALIPAFVVSSQIEQSLERSQMAERLHDGFDDEWYREFRVDARGFSDTFTPAVTGIGGVLEALDAFLNGGLWKQYAPIVGLGLLLLLVWTFAAGGILSTYHQEGGGSGEFWAACGRHFGPLLRLLLLAGLFYVVAYRFLLPWVDHAIQTVNRQTIDERVAFAWVVGKYLLVLAYVFAVNLVFDYAKIVCVAQDRRSALAAASEALKLVWRRPLATIGLYLALGVVGVLLLLLYALVAPGALQTGYFGLAVVFVLGQAYVLSRVALRLYYFAAQTDLYRRLAGPHV